MVWPAIPALSKFARALNAGLFDLSCIKGRLTLVIACCSSQDIVVRTSDMHSIIDIETGSVINPPKDVVFGDRVWIGQGCIIDKGARIGSDTVIGARSLVTGEIPPNVVAYGAPAEVRRRGIRWSVDAP